MSKWMKLPEQPPSGFNLSRWAIGHPSIARFLFGLIIVGRRARPDAHGPEGRPGFHLPRHGRAGGLARRLDPGDGETRSSTRSSASCRKRRISISSAPTPAPAAPSSPCRSKGDTDPLRSRMPFTRCARRSAISPTSCPQGLLGPYFNDEFGDTFITLHSISGDGYSLSRTEEIRHPGARHAADARPASRRP